jgi:hypothetical protein
MFFRDLDTGKAIMIYSTSRMEAAETLFKMGQAAAAVQELERARRISPELGPQITQMMNSYGVR